MVVKPIPTLDDVARLARVSPATASRAINQPHRVREETRLRVEAAVSDLRYAPNFGGRVLASRRTDTFGAIIPTMENAIFARALQTMQETMGEAGRTLLLATSDYNADREARQVTTLLGRGVDGLMLIGEAREPAVYVELERRGTPCVLTWIWRPDCPWPCVGFDNRAAARAMAALVLRYGHRRIAMIAGITKDNDRAGERVAGVRAELDAHGLRLEPSQLIESEYTLAAGAAAAGQLLSLSSRPTAIVCGNDVLAAGAYLAARDRGLLIPGDLSITGFDDIDIAEMLDPPLTTVHIPHRRMGVAAARLLLALRDGQPTDQAIRFEPELVERGSLAQAP